MPNLFDPAWDMTRAQGPFRWRRAFVGRQAGARDLGASLFEVEPGAQTFPLHVHFHNEELLIILDGELTLTTLAGTRALVAGDVVACPAGREGAHGLVNTGGRAARVLIVSTMRKPEINEFPETGELWMRDYVPGTDPPPDALDVRRGP